MRTLVVGIVLAGLTFSPRLSSAHHQLDKTYVRERTIVLTGTITLASGEQLVASTDGSWSWREMGKELGFSPQR